MGDAPNQVKAELNFFDGDAANAIIDVIPSRGTYRFEFKGQNVPIQNARGYEKSFVLDRNGFQFVDHVCKEKEFVNDEKIKAEYHPEIEDMLQKLTGANRVVAFDHTVRRNYDINKPDNEFYRRPSRYVHVDQNRESAENRVRNHVEGDVEELLKGRVRIINVWKPIENPVHHYPLGVTDFTSVDVERDMVKTYLKKWTGEESSFYTVRYHPTHNWYFLDEQAPDELLFLKNYDSDPEPAPFAIHTAFVQPSDPAKPQRQSIELRALIFG